MLVHGLGAVVLSQRVGFFDGLRRSPDGLALPAAAKYFVVLPRTP